MAVNKEPFVRSRSKDGLPHVFRGVVQAGSTQAIKRGEIVCYGATTGYWTPVTLAAHYVYPLAIAKEEQKAADLERYIELYSLHPDDEFEFALDAARSLALGDTFILTASDSQSLTYSASAFPVARCVDDGHYPETGTHHPQPELCGGPIQHCGQRLGAHDQRRRPGNSQGAGDAVRGRNVVERAKRPRNNEQ